MPLDQLPDNYFDDQKEMSFFDHIDELRGHMFRSVIAIVVMAVLAFVNKHLLFDIILFGPKNLDFWTYRKMCELSYYFTNSDAYCVKEIGFTLSNISITGQFTQHIFIAFIAGLILAFPYVVFEFWRFIKPALSKKERSYASGLVFFVSALFFTGILFGYFFITPVSVNFLGGYRVSEQVSNEINLESYISFVASMTFAAGIVFELPMLVYFLAKIGLMSSAWMRKYRRHAIVVILIISAILTPSPDVASQMMMGIPLYALFEVSIWVARGVEKKDEKDKD